MNKTVTTIEIVISHEDGVDALQQVKDVLEEKGINILSAEKTDEEVFCGMEDTVIAKTLQERVARPTKGLYLGSNLRTGNNF